MIALKVVQAAAALGVLLSRNIQLYLHAENLIKSHEISHA
jgi:hypothetical protein